MSDQIEHPAPAYTISDAWDDAARWMARYRAATPDDERKDIDIYLDPAMYTPMSPYWGDSESEAVQP